VDDFLGLSQGQRQRRQNVRRTLFHTIDQVIRPLDDDDPPSRQEPISIKKLKKGDGKWCTKKTFLGWIIDTVAGTIELPSHRKERLRQMLYDEIPDGQARISVRKWHKILGELRSMTIAVPGARGFFSHLQAALNSQQTGRIRVSSHIRATILDLRWLAASLEARPTRLRELVAAPPELFGTVDASGQGMGGAIFPKTNHDPPLVWRAQFPSSITQQLVTQYNLKGKVTNSDLELAAIILQHDVYSQHYDIRECTVHSNSDNKSAVSWQTHGSTTTDSTPAYLLRLQAIHQRVYRYIPLVSYIPGPVNAIADDASRLWHRSDSQLLTHFDHHYPQALSWQLCQPRPEMLSFVISALQRQRPPLESFLAEPPPPELTGELGSNFATRSDWTHTSRRSTTPLSSSKSTLSDTVKAKLPPVVAQSDLEPLKTHFEPLAKRSRHWGPRTHASTPSDK
jgi:hypothetical protein